MYASYQCNGIHQAEIWNTSTEQWWWEESGTGHETYGPFASQEAAAADASEKLGVTIKVGVECAGQHGPNEPCTWD